MKTIYAKHEPYTNGHLGEVKEDMQLACPPTIRVMKFKDGYYALEGSHRLAAAYELGIIPKIVVLSEDNNDLDDHWSEVAKTLPSYDYDHLLVFDFAKFEKEINSIG